MSGSEPITSPDQRKPVSRKAARAGALITAALLLLMIMGNHKGNVENIFLIVIAGLLVLAVVTDWLLRKNGFRT